MDYRALKKDLRKRLDQERRALTPEVMAEKSKQVFERWLARFTMKPVLYLHLFQSIKKRNEIDTQYYMDYVRSRHDHVKIVVPVINPYSDHLWHVELLNDIEMEVNHFGIPEPKLPHKKVFPMQLDMVLIPMLGFDMAGNRLGYGKGMYDRFLELTHPECIKVGLCLEQGKIEEGLPTEPHDIPLDYVVTESAVYRFSGNTQGV